MEQDPIPQSAQPSHSSPPAIASLCPLSAPASLAANAAPTTGTGSAFSEQEKGLVKDYLLEVASNGKSNDRQDAYYSTKDRLKAAQILADRMFPKLTSSRADLVQPISFVFVNVQQLASEAHEFHEARKREERAARARQSSVSPEGVISIVEA